VSTKFSEAAAGSKQTLCRPPVGTSKQIAQDPFAMAVFTALSSCSPARVDVFPQSTCMGGQLIPRAVTWHSSSVGPAGLPVAMNR
jgi:hypothetical protein